jgi:blue copper oxidase
MTRTDAPGGVGDGLFTRRRLVATAIVTAGALTTGGAATVATPARAKGGSKKPPPGRNPLYVPPEVSPATLTLTQAPGSADLGGGAHSTVWAYNGSFPGPTIRTRPGDHASIHLVNGLSQPSITHWHGMLVDHENDGHPRSAVGPGGTYDYGFTIDQRACMNWYHPHPHMLTGEQVYMGLAGAFIINDAEEDALGLPAGSRELPLVIRDASADKAGNLVYTPKNGGFLGTFPLVNGTRNARVDVDSAVYRLRILNGANSRIFGLTLGNGAPFVLIGNDGGLLREPVTIGRVDISNGERVDLLADLRGLAVGTRVMLRDARAGWDLLELVVVRTASGGPGIPAGPLSTVPALSGPSQPTRTFSFDGHTRINGRSYDHHRIDFEVPFATTERWRFTTKGNAPHPVHVHGAYFQVQSRTGGRNQVFPWERGWKDTVLLENNETVDVLIRFVAHRGLYLLHCHKLEHEDMGMMSNFVVV